MLNKKRTKHNQARSKRVSTINQENLRRLMLIECTRRIRNSIGKEMTVIYIIAAWVVLAYLVLIMFRNIT